ncbi:MAG: aminotransferase class V-fold PLP-dependent enzyme [Polyangiaceae bacterium]
MIYLNHAGTSWPKAPPVAEAMARALAESPLEWGARFGEAHSKIGSFFGIEDVSRLLLTPACTSALSVGVADHAWGAGESVVLSGLEHHALHRPALALAERGVRVEIVPRSTEGPFSLEGLEACLRKGGVRLVAMTAASNVTGEMLPYREAAALARQYEALFLLDAAQGAGWVDLDMREGWADLMAFAGHKGLNGPWGIGGLYVAPGVVMASPAAQCEVPAARGGVGGTGASGAAASGAAASGAAARGVVARGAAASGVAAPRGCSAMPGYCDVGSVDRAALAGLAGAVEWLSLPGQAERLGRARGRIRRLREGLSEMRGVRLIGSGKIEESMPVAAFTVEGRSPSEIANGLAARGVVAGGGLFCAPLAHETMGTAPDGVVRMSAGATTTEEDIEQAIAALTALV